MIRRGRTRRTLLLLILLLLLLMHRLLLLLLLPLLGRAVGVPQHLLGLVVVIAGVRW
jgi:hypothetical protein